MKKQKIDGDNDLFFVSLYFAIALVSRYSQDSNLCSRKKLISLEAC